MNKHLFLSLAISLATVATLSAQNVQARHAEPKYENKPLKIVFDNDVHGAIDRYEYLAGYRDALRADGYPVLTVSVGDYLQGSAYAAVSKGQFCVDMLNAVGYDVLAVGNHDVDYGLKRLLTLRDALTPQTAMVCANLFDGDHHRCLPAFTMCNIAGYRVAFIGVLTTATEILEANVLYEDGHPQCSFGKDSLVQLVQQTIDRVRLGNPDWVILLTHMGVDPLGDHLASWQLLEQLHGVDVLIDGHSHSVINTSVVSANPNDKDVVWAQTGSGMTNVGCLTLQRDEAPRIKLYAYQNLPQSDPVHYAYQQVVDQMQPILGEVVGYTPFELQYRINGERAVRNRETNLGDLISDAYRTLLSTDIGWVNGGGIRTGINMGDITYGQVLSVSPFNNFMCIAEVTGDMLADALEECYHNTPVDLGSFAHISGIRCVVDTSVHNTLSWTADNRLQVKGQRRVSNIEVYKDGQWRAVKSSDHFTLAATNYVVYEGESRGLKNAKILQDKVMTDTECLQKYIMSTLQGTIPDRYQHPQSRIRFKK